MSLITALVLAVVLVQTSPVQTWLVRLVTHELSARLNAEVSVGRVYISFFNRVALKDVMLKTPQADTLLYVHTLKASVSRLRIPRKFIRLDDVTLERVVGNLNIDDNGVPNFRFLMDTVSDTIPRKPPEWKISCESFRIVHARIGYSWFDSHIRKQWAFDDINLAINKFRLRPDTVAFVIDRLNFRSDINPYLSNCHAEITATRQALTLADISLDTENSHIEHAGLTLGQSPVDSTFMIEAHLVNAEISLEDVAVFVPAIKGMNEKIGISGQFTGNLTTLNANDLTLNIGGSTSLRCDLALEGLSDIEHTYIYLKLDELSANFRDLAHIRLPDSAKNRYPDIPAFLFDAGTLSYQGVFNGFIDDFVAYGKLKSNFGQLSTDLSFTPMKNKNIAIEGKLKTVNFRLGKFVHSGRLGVLTFNGSINGVYNTVRETLDGTVKGMVDSMIYADYKYRRLSLDGAITGRKFEGNLQIDDANLKGIFAGGIDLQSDKPVSDFELYIKKADLVALHIDSIHRRSDLSFGLHASFSGNTVDNIDGNIRFTEGQYCNENDSLYFESIRIATFHDGVRRLQMYSDFLDFDMSGSWEFGAMAESVRNILRHYISALESDTPPAISGKTGKKQPPVASAPRAAPDNFKIQASIKDLSPLTKTFIPNLSISPAELTCLFDELSNTVELYTYFPVVCYKDVELTGYSFSVHSGSNLEIKNRAKRLQIGESVTLYNFAALVEAGNNRANTKISWNNQQEMTYSGLLDIDMLFTANLPMRPQIDMQVHPSKIYIADTLWQVHSATVRIGADRTQISRFTVSHAQQKFMIDGALAKDSLEKLNISVENFNLNNINAPEARTRFYGTLSGEVSISDFYRKVVLLANLNVNKFGVNSQQLGDVAVGSRWNPYSGAITADMTVTDNDRQSLDVWGDYYVRRDSVDFLVTMNRFPLSTLETVLGSVFDRVDGLGSGSVRIHGNTGKLLMDGAALAENAALKIGYPQTTYQFSDSIRFQNDSLVFSGITLYDKDRNTGVFNGVIRHDNFSNMDYDLSCTFRRMLLYDTTPSDNQQFNGKIYGGGNFRFTGHGRNLSMSANARTLSGTGINISLDYEKGAEVNNFIHFVNHQRMDDNTSYVMLPAPDNGGIDMNFNVEATPEARIQLIYNASVGDIITAQGSGNVQVHIDPRFDISLFGTYKVEKGDYEFTLQNVISKRFDIEQGSSITWNGDPTNANINLTAMYRLRTSLKELFASDPSETYTQRIPVVCAISLTDNLNNPKIGFDIQLPTADDRIRDNVRQFFNTTEDMNKQVLSLLVLNKFTTPDYLRGSYDASNAANMGVTASEVLSNQLSNLLSEISNSVDVGVNYRPGNQLTDDEIELALSTQLLNDRVTIEGNIGNNSRQYATSNSNNTSSIVGDFDLNVKLTNNGKLQFKAYNHSNNNIIYETSPYTQGVGFSFREDYDTLDELWKKFSAIFRSRKRPRHSAREGE